MARMGRLAGSLLVESEGTYSLVGFPKEPCDFAKHGLGTPPAPEAWGGPFVTLAHTAHVDLGNVILSFSLEGPALLSALAARLLVTRNSSVSERLYRQIVEADDEGNVAPGVRDARWLTDMPLHLWTIVRDSVLRCS
jgi:hypothetical protein